MKDNIQNSRSPNKTAFKALRSRITKDQTLSPLVNFPQHLTSVLIYRLWLTSIHVQVIEIIYVYLSQDISRLCWPIQTHSSSATEPWYPRRFVCRSWGSQIFCVHFITKAHCVTQLSLLTQQSLFWSFDYSEQSQYEEAVQFASGWNGRL